MQLNLSTDYAIRAVLYLSAVKRSADSVELSEVLHVPQRYLLNICAKLRRAGLLHAVPGHGGGIRLARPAAEIRLLDVITVMEPSMRINRCLEEDHHCSRDAICDCSVRSVYEEAQQTLERIFSISFEELALRNGGFPSR